MTNPKPDCRSDLERLLHRQGGDADTGRVTYDGWFTRYPPSKSNPEVVTTQWEFGIDGLTEEQAIEIDRRIQAIVDEVRGEHMDLAASSWLSAAGECEAGFKDPLI